MEGGRKRDEGREGGRGMERETKLRLSQTRSIAAVAHVAGHNWS